VIEQRSLELLNTKISNAEQLLQASFVEFDDVIEALCTIADSSTLMGLLDE
jgi:hypothetical protein